MIFEEDYDKSLWCIVKADRKNRKELVEFVKGIPNTLLENLRESLEKLKKGELSFDEEFGDFNGCQSTKEPEVSYYYQIDRDESLTITKSLKENGIEKDLFELLLFPINKDNLKNMDFFEDEWLGTVTNNIKTTAINDHVGIIDCCENEYNIYKTPIGYFVGYQRELFQGKIGLNIFKPVNSRGIFKDIQKEDLMGKRLQLRKH